MKQFKTYALSKKQLTRIKGAQDGCYEDRRVGNCDGGSTQYYFWNSCTGECRTMLGEEADDCTPC